MARFIKDRSNAKGQIPGSLIFIGKQKMEKPIIQLMEYDSENLVEKELKSIDEALPHIQSGKVTWINIYGIHDLEMIEKIGELFNIHSLLLEDILNTDQRPKYDDAENCDVFILKMLHHDEAENEIVAEQISIILGENYVLTLQERPGDVFTPVRERIRQKKGRIRDSDNDYLAYSLFDTIADNYTLLVEKIGHKIEDLEDRIFLKKDNTIVEEIYNYKIELNFLRKSIRPVKDVMTHLLKSENSYFLDKTKRYLLDLNDLIIQSTDAIELYNNLVSEQLNFYNTNVANRMNEVMKVLTTFASIFIPLTFLAGIYGMNFYFMPELNYKYSYPIFWGVAIVTAVALLIFFKRKRWL